MPRVTGILETAIHVENVAKSARFYEDLFGFEKMLENERICAFAVPGRDVFLLFKRGATLEPLVMPGGIIPPHGSEGVLHFAFAIERADLEPWEKKLREKGIPLESKVQWEEGGVSLYFRDPDNHVVELATPGTWPNY
jgi:catechol 2,3-dioxygenase-like lactoylglutathione lyase family enzyme